MEETKNKKALIMAVIIALILIVGIFGVVFSSIKSSLLNKWYLIKLLKIIHQTSITLGLSNAKSLANSNKWFVFFIISFFSFDDKESL